MGQRCGKSSKEALKHHPPGGYCPREAQTADKHFPGGLEGPQVRNLNLRGGRWPRPPLVSVDSSGSLCHLRWQVPTGHTLPSVPLQSGFVSPGFPRSLNLHRGCYPHPLLVSLPTFGSLCHLRWQQPTGLTLPSGAGRAGSLRPWAQTFLKHLAEKAAVGGLFRQTDPPGDYCPREALFSPGRTDQ